MIEKAAAVLAALLLVACAAEKDEAPADLTGGVSVYLETLEGKYGVEIRNENLARSCDNGNPEACMEQGLEIDRFLVDHADTDLPRGTATPLYVKACEMGSRPACGLVDRSPAGRLRSMGI